MAEFIVELLVVLDAQNAASAARSGERLAAVLLKSGKAASVSNVIVADVRGDDAHSGEERE